MRNSTTDEIIGSYQDRFTGLGKLKDFKLELYVDESINPVAHFGCRVNTEHQTFVPIQVFMTHECGDKS
jgi:hypothetical protein